MKKTLILGAMLAGAVGAQAQGTVAFSDGAGGFEIHIYAPQAASPGTEVQGNAGNDQPSGSTTYDAGSAIGGSGTGTGYGNGNNVSVELYGLTGAGDSLASVQANPLSQYVGHAGTKSAAAAGLFVDTFSGTDPGIPNTSGGVATVALAAWWNPGGAYPTIGAAQAAGQAYGWSDTATITALGGTGSPPAPNPSLAGLTSFSLISVTTSPEPSTIALGIMGASAFLARRRFSK